MLHWPSPWRTAETQPPPLPAGPSVFDRWLADTGRRPDRHQVIRYTSKTRSTSPGRRPTRSLRLVWPDRERATSARQPTTSLFCFASQTTQEGDHATGEQSQGRDPRHAPEDDAGNPAETAHDRRYDDDDYEPYDPADDMIFRDDWRTYIEERLDMGLTHYNVCTCTAGMPTDADAQHFDALLREIVASRPELGTVESIGGYPETLVVLGAARAVVQRERQQQQQQQEP